MQPGACFTRRIGSTKYKVHIFFTGSETMEEKILHLVREECLDYGEKRGIISMPQMRTEPERRLG